MALLGFDSFARNNQSNGWGTASNGVAWSVALGSNSRYAIASNEGTVSGTTSETAQFVGTGNKISANFGVIVRASRATNTVSSTSILARASVSGGNLTGYKLRLKSGNLDLVSEVAGTGTVIATIAYAATLGLYDYTHLQVIGNQLWANAWPDGTDEPPDWMIGPITSNTITGTGQCGLVATLQPGDTASFDTFSWDNLTTGAFLADGPLGFTVLNKNPISPDTLVDIVSSNATWIRPQTNWELMEKTDDGSRGSTLSSVIDWTLPDVTVAACNSLGLNICWPVQNPPMWHCSTVTSPANPHNPIEIPLLLDTVAFATAVITRYNGRTINPATGNPYGTIQALMFNEDWDPYAAGWTGNGNPSYIGRSSTPLAPILQALYPIVKAQLPTCRVGCASLLGKRTDVAHITAWVHDLFTAWAGGVYADFLDYHFYNCNGSPIVPNPNLNDPPLPARITAIKAVCAAFGHPSMDIWNTEFGYQYGNIPPTACDCASTAQQSAYIIETLQVALNAGVSHCFYYTIGSLDKNSIVQGHGTNKVYLPAYYAWQNFGALHPQFPTPVVAFNAPVRSGQIVARIPGTGEASA